MGFIRIKAPLRASNWAMALLGAFVSLSAFLSGLEAFAGNTAIPAPNTISFPGAAPAWTDSTQYVDCGQDCLYQKGNENLTLQAIYIIKKMDNLEKIVNGTDDEDQRQVITELKLYCPEVSPTSVSPDDAKTCYKRYVQTQLPVLRAMKATMLKNEDMTARLKSDQGAFGGTPSTKVSAFQDQTPGQRKAQTPEFSKEAELMTPQAGDRLRYLSQENYAQWATQVSDLAPKKEDFPLTQLSKKDPNDPSSPLINKIVRDNLGNPIINEKAFEVAKKEYETHVLGNTAPATNTPVEYDLTKIPQKKPGAYTAKTKIGEVDFRPQPKGKPAPSAIEDISYRQARNLVVDSEANLFQRAAKGPKSNQGAPRAPAGTAGGAKPASQPQEPGYGYAEVVTKQKNLPESTVNPVPKNGANTTYSVTLSPEQLDKQISEFQKSADDL